MVKRKFKNVIGRTIKVHSQLMEPNSIKEFNVPKLSRAKSRASTSMVGDKYWELEEVQHKGS